MISAAMHDLSPSDWVQIAGDGAIVSVTGIYVFFTWRLASLAKAANRVSSRLLETSHRVQLDARLPLYVLSCEDFHWGPPQQGEVQDAEYIMTWRIDLLSTQPARLSVLPPARVTCAMAFNGHRVTRPIHLASRLGRSHTISWRVRIEPGSPDPGGMQAYLRLDDFIESVTDTIRLTATWQTAELAALAPVADIDRRYPGTEVA